MKCKIKPVYNGQHAEPKSVVEVKLHRHTIEIEGLTENDSFELESYFFFFRLLIFENRLMVF